MKRSVLNHRRYGLPEMGNEEICAFGRERYEDLLREADQYHLEHRVSPSGQLARPMARSLLAHLLIWTGILRASKHACSPATGSETSG